MYQVSIVNSGVESIIHTPNSDPNSTHLTDMKLSLTENEVNLFSFTIFSTHKFYNVIFDFITTIKVLDIINNKNKFEGRVLLSEPQMNENGEFYKEVKCESELGYFNDSLVDQWELYPSTLPSDAPSYAEANYTIKLALQKIVSNHNDNVEDFKKFTLGTVDLTDPIYLSTNGETSLATIIKIATNNKAIIKIRKENGIRYLDLLTDNPSVSSTQITLKKNLKSFKRTPDYSSFCTRLIGIGSNGLSFSDINNGKQYVEDPIAIAKYGIVTRRYELTDETSKETLLQKTIAELNSILNDSYVSINVSALDLKCIGLTPEEFDISTKYLVQGDSTFNYVLKVIKLDIDLLQPWNSGLTFSNIKASLIKNSVNLFQKLLETRNEFMLLNNKTSSKVENYYEVSLEGIAAKADSSSLPQIITKDTDNGFNISNGLLKVTNSDNKVTFDGQYSTFKILKTNTVTITRLSTDTIKTYIFAHELTEKPMLYAFKEGSQDRTTFLFDVDDLMNINSIISFRVDNTSVYIDWKTKTDYPITSINLTYILFKDQ